MKFTPQGGQISLSASENGDFIRFEISDSGAGIEAGRLASLFASAEFAAKTQMPAANEGTGLGLIICKDFVETNGGKIGVQSAKGQGSCFWFEIPCGVRPGRDEADVLAAERNLSRLKALVVEDNAIHLSLVEAILVELGISAEMVGDGQQAWDMLQTEHFDFVLLDGKLPVLDGFALAGKISTLNKGSAVIFHSSFSEQEILDRVSREHFDAILPKPLSKEALVRVISALPPRQR